MATQETRILDNVIASRRALLVGGGAALAGLALTGTARAASTVTTYADTDILNFALNLEYLEANFYYLAAFGTNISTTNSLYPSGAMVQGITGTGTQGTVTVKTGPKVPFTSLQVASYAVETPCDGKHVNSPPYRPSPSPAVTLPLLDLMTSFNTLASAAGIGPAFDPFASDANFLIGAYIFEDVGVTAYRNRSLFTTGTAGKSYLARRRAVWRSRPITRGWCGPQSTRSIPPARSDCCGYTRAIFCAARRRFWPSPASASPAIPFDPNLPLTTACRNDTG